LSKILENILEILVSLLIVGGLLYVAFYVKPHVTVPEYSPTLFGYRDHYYGVVSPDSDNNVIWAVGNNGRVIRSDNAGADWRIQETGTKNHLQSIAAWDSDAAIVVGDLATVLITDDGGASWTRIPVEVREWGDQLLQVQIDHARGQAWITGTMGTVFRSVDRGRSWTMAHETEDLAWNGITVTESGRIWVVGEFGRLQRSDDDGATWEEIEAPTMGSSLMAIAFADPQNGMAVGLSGVVVRTSDGGDSWTLLEDVTQAHFFDVIWDGRQYVAVGDNGTLATFPAVGEQVNVGRVHPDNSLWYTQIASLAKTDGYLIAGTNLGLRRGSEWNVYQ